MKHLYKSKDGNTYCKAAATTEEEVLLRSEGFKLPEELWATEPAKEQPKPKQLAKK
jgi:hypothetical protein